MSATTFRTTIQAVLAFAALWAAAVADAQTTYTWDGGGNDNLWSTGTNWVGDSAPVRGTSTFLTFAGSTRTSPFNDGGDFANVAGLTFASGASSFRIEGNNIGFVNSSGQQVINQNAATTQDINAVFSFGSNQDSQINLNAGDLLISAANTYIDSNGSATRKLTIAGTDSTRRTITYAGNLNKSFSGNDPDMFIQNNKRVLAMGSLTFGSGNDGSVFIDDGVLQFSGAGSMSSGSPVIGNTSGSSNAALLLDTAGATFARQIEIRGGSSGQRMVGGINTSGTVTYSGNFVATNSPSDYDLKATSGGAANFSGTRNFTSKLHVNRPDGVTTYGGTVVLSGTTNSTEGTGVYGGTLQFSDFNQLGSDYFEFDAASGDSGTLRYTGGSTTTTKTLWLDNSGLTRAAVDVSQAGTTLTWNPGGGTRSTNLTKTGAGWLFFGGGITGGTVGVESGLLVLTASNSYSGGTTVTGGTLEVSAGGGAGGNAAGLGTGTVSIGSGGQVTYWLSQSAANTITNAFSLSGGTLYTQDGSNTYSGQVTLASGSSTISGKYEDTIRLSGGLTGSGNVLFTQTGGTGVWAAPTYVVSGMGANTGTVRVSGSSGGGATKLQLANVSALQSATLDMAAGDAGTVEFTVAGNNNYSLGGLQGARNLAFGGNSLSIGGNGQSTTYSGVMTGSGSLTKVGSGRLVLTGGNTFAGATNVNAGELAINGSIAGSLNVALVAGLSGTGTVGGNATIIGTHSPGNSPGAQTFNANLTYEAGAVVNWELIANTTGSAGVNYDQIIVPTGNLTFSGSTTLALSFNSLGSAVDWTDSFWDVNRSWTVYDLSAGTTSNLGNLALGGSLLDSLSNPLSQTARGYFTTSLAGQDVMLNFVAVPEPTTCMLLAAGGGMLVASLMRRRRKQAS